MENHDQGLIVPGQIDSLMKLRLILLFAESPWLRLSKVAAQQRLRESPWAIAEALEQLHAAGLLAGDERLGQPEYWLTTSPERRTRIERLARSFDDPQRRDELYALARAADDERRFRELGATYVHLSAIGEFDTPGF